MWSRRDHTLQPVFSDARDATAAHQRILVVTAIR
jgi:hypothetical protein